MIKNNFTKLLSVSAVMALLFAAPSAYATDDNPPISWGAFYEAIYTYISDVDGYLLEKILLEFESNLASRTPIRVQEFFGKCLSMATREDCAKMTTAIVNIHNKRVEHASQKCADLVMQVISAGGTNMPAVEYISRKSFAFEEYQNALDEYQMAARGLIISFGQNAGQDESQPECKTLKKQLYKVLEDTLVERNLFIQTLDGTAINLNYAYVPDFQTRLDDARDAIADKIGSDYILLDDIECEGSETSTTVHCSIKPVYGSRPVSIRVTTNYMPGVKQ